VPIRVRCPKCNETADLPDEARGKKGLCNRCGTPVQIPAEIKKVCVFCHADVTDTAHIKDPEKNYVCETCWKGRHPEPPRLQDTVAPAAPMPEPDPQPDSVPTTTLDPDFATPDPSHAAAAEALPDVDHHDDDAALVNDWPYDHKPFPAPRRRKPRRASRLSSLFSLVALLVSLGSAYFVWPHARNVTAPVAPSWEEAHRAQILVLKGQAEILIELGHVQEGVARYEELERLVKEKMIRDPVLRDALLAAWRDRDTAISRHQIVQQVAQAASGATGSATPAETTVTLIEDPAEPVASRPARRPDTSPIPTTQRSAFDPN
jgi:hypothetical protein